MTVSVQGADTREPFAAARINHDALQAGSHQRGHDATRQTDSLDAVRARIDTSVADDRAVLLPATTQELGATREAVLDAVMTRLELSRKHAIDAYGLAEQFETNPDPSGANRTAGRERSADDSARRIRGQDRTI